LITTETRTDHLATAARLAADPESWPVAPRFSLTARWYHRIVAEPDSEAWLLTWLPGQGTELHDHGGSAGALYVLSGRLTEEVVTRRTLNHPGPVVTTREIAGGSGHRFGPRHIHRVTNHTGQPAISIHVYGPALRTMTRYELTDAGLQMLAIDRAGAQW
jgi:hypothetical protein